ncbi:MAG: hypothetical protein K0M56_07540 [Kaistella sp.]|nr:hypothetical protein [Kaistella sp.]
MKTTHPLLFLVFFLMVLNCKKNSSEKPIQKITVEQNIQPFFDYDKIEYYHSNIDNSLNGLNEIYDKLEENQIDSLQFKVLIGNVPENNIDSGSVNKLNQIGFRKIPLSDKKQNELKVIFVAKNRKSEPKDGLKPIFTDILVFKKQNKIVGFSKLSFKYLQSIIIGSKLNSGYFPTNAEHQKIEKILTESYRKNVAK